MLAGLVALVAVLHGMAIAYSLYWRLSWFDNLPHFFGGMFVSLLCVWLWFFSGYMGEHPLPSAGKLFLVTVLCAFVIGVGWEVFERLLGLTWSPEGYWIDTGSDILSDVLGGVATYFLLRLLARPSPR